LNSFLRFKNIKKDLVIDFSQFIKYLPQLVKRILKRLKKGAFFVPLKGLIFRLYKLNTVGRLLYMKPLDEKLSGFFYA